MLISEQKSFIFVHVQKTAGTSLTDILQPYALNPADTRWHRLASDIGLIRDWRKRYFRKHAPLRLAESRLPAEFYRHCYKFAFVRNPWDRLASWYRYVQNTPSHREHKVGQNFETFALAFIAKPRRSQWEMLVNRNGKPGLDFIGRFENLQEDIRHLCRQFEILMPPLPHHNLSQPQDYRSYYSDALAEAVQLAWQKEIDHFNYRFDR